jgi:hypothetical protein
MNHVRDPRSSAFIRGQNLAFTVEKNRRASQLRTLRVQATQVSEAGAAQLKKTLPEVTLER